MYDLIIIGGGPAGSAAGVYAARKHLKSALITESFGGQSVVSTGVQNWIGDIEIPGEELAKKFEAHVRAYAGDFLDVKEGEKATSIEKTEGGFSVKTNKETYETKTVLIAVGADRRKLKVPGAAEFENKGVVYCASCDGPLFAGMDVAVIGGGNAGFETAAQLLAYAKSVTLLHRSESFKADEITVKKVLSHPNMTALTNTEPTEVLGDKFVSGLKWKNNQTKETGGLAVTGVFVEIGIMPNTYVVDGLVELDEYNRIKVDPRNQRTSLAGLWAAGDITDCLYHQNNIAAGDGVKALEDIYLFLNAQE
jgi:alkyl hydroperoxide reductase subunit F